MQLTQTMKLKEIEKIQVAFKFGMALQINRKPQ